VAEIRLQQGESLENALRRFKRKVQVEDIIKEVKRHSYYLKPGERRPPETGSGAEARAEKVSERRFVCEGLASGQCVIPESNLCLQIAGA